MRASQELLRKNAEDIIDQAVLFHDVPWSVYEALVDARGEKSVPRLSYLRGALEIMTPSKFHEGYGKRVARLLEAWSEEMGTELDGYGRWTQRDKAKKLGAEPDECYVVGSREAERPDIVIEVVWTSGGIWKLDIYKEFSIPEVWFWKDHSLSVYVLRAQKYVEREHSHLLPELDLRMLARFAEERNQLKAVREFRGAVRKRRRMST
jgi:Uma2 family endonuclease